MRIATTIKSSAAGGTRHVFLLVVLLCGGAGLAGLYWVQSRYDAAPLELLVKLLERQGVDTRPLLAVLEPGGARETPFAERFVSERPRIWPSRLVRSVAAERATVCGRNDALFQAVCWAVFGEADAGRLASEHLLGARIAPLRRDSSDGAGWRWAFVYDLLADHPALTAPGRTLVEDKLEAALADYLALLDSVEPSLWHGRASLAAQAWIVAVALGEGPAARVPLLRRAHGHFLETIAALRLTEAWPEGYNYWINNRAFSIALAGAAYLNGLDSGANAELVRGALVRNGLWHIHATRPDNRIEPYADEGPRDDLKDETQRVVDLLARLLDSPALAEYSGYLDDLWGAAGYYDAFLWGRALFRGAPGTGAAKRRDATLERMRLYAPLSGRFGAGAMEQIYLRSDWSPDATFVSLRAGHRFTHHGHNDGGHFTLFKGAPLAVNSSTYNGFLARHRLDYAIRTVAKNSLLILRPGERVHPNRFFDHNVADGGQRVRIPTGSAIRSVAHWREQLGDGQHLEGARVDAFGDDGDLVYVAADLTAAYNSTVYDDGGAGGKVRRVNRELVYLRDEDRLIVHDRVVSTHASYTKKWLLHTLNKPEVSGLAQLRGVADDGIAESSAARALVAAGTGRLVVDRVFPRNGIVRLVGGTTHRYYVEVDGDESDLDGRSMLEGMSTEPWFDQAYWRMEVQPAEDREEDRFLMVLSPSLHDYRLEPVQPLESADGGVRGMRTQISALLFVDAGVSGPARIAWDGAVGKLHLFGLPPMRAFSVSSGGESVRGRADIDGKATLDLSQLRAPGGISLDW